jgi:4-amino-4-deoxy-L-arabinose transferase-like glycosyltransferase
LWVDVKPDGIHYIQILNLRYRMDSPRMVQYAGAPGQDKSSGWRKTLSHLREFYSRHQNTITFIVVGLLAIYAVIEMVHATSFGPAFGSDSVTYMESAKNLVAGNGLGLINPDGSFRFLPYAPPLYPLVLSIFAVLGLDLLQAGFWFNGLLFMLLVVLMGWSAWRFLHSSLAAVMLAALLTLSTVMISLHIWIMTDALGLTVGMAALVLLVSYLENRSKKAFFGSALLAGLALLTRYAGGAYLLTAVLAVIMLGSQSFKKRLVAAGIYALVSILPNAIWLIIDTQLTGSVGSRSIQPVATWLPSSLDVIRTLKESVYLWLPSIMTLSKALGQQTFRLTYLGLALIIGGACAFAIIRSYRRQPGGWKRATGINYVLVFVAFSAIYLVYIIASYAAIYPPLTLSDRMFAPLNVSLLVFLSAILALLFDYYGHWLARLGTIILSGLLLLAFIQGARSQIALHRQYPPGYTGFKGTALVEYLKGLPQDIPIISDRASIIQYYVGRPAYPIQEFFSVAGTDQYLPFGSDQQDAAQVAFREEGGALVLFWMVQSEFTGLYGEQADERYSQFIKGLYLAFDSPEGKVYFYTPPVK